MLGINKVVFKGAYVNDGIVSLQKTIKNERETTNPHLTHGQFIIDHSAVSRICEDHGIPYPQRSGPDVQVLLVKDSEVKAKGKMYLRGPNSESIPWVEKWVKAFTDISGVCTVLLVEVDTPQAAAVPADMPPANVKVAGIIHQVTEENVIADVHQLYRLVVHNLKSKTVCQRRKSHTNRQKFHCAGKVLILTDPSSVSPGYRDLKGKSEDPEIRNLADTIWLYVCGIAPFLAKYKEDGLKGEFPELLLGASGWNVFAISCNACVELHLDTKDGLWSIIVWIHGGKGLIEGGAFCLPGFNVRFIPGTLTMAIINARDYVHGTAPHKIPCGSTARRWGSSFFLRVGDLMHLMELKEGLDAKGTSFEKYQKEVDERVRKKTGWRNRQMQKTVAAERKLIMSAGRKLMANRGYKPQLGQ
ncbi:hypothetical protein VaNZ11_013779 [Volvox africanus]|uniref:Uncharacterized protein n=1 Tax=Volvox africanus TaxID=51714 RepID=A0ABQ5SHU9_9CHLO|nr:hypothetical protein VaNZ11_013779 [Volvox africanus]